jgi:hypothetical protein
MALAWLEEYLYKGLANPDITINVKDVKVKEAKTQISDLFVSRHTRITIKNNH